MFQSSQPSRGDRAAPSAGLAGRDRTSAPGDTRSGDAGGGQRFMSSSLKTSNSLPRASLGNTDTI